MFVGADGMPECLEAAILRRIRETATDEPYRRHCVPHTDKLDGYVHRECVAEVIG